VGRETKFGLLVGLVFIVLFGVILGNRTGPAPQEHAALPVGESEGHRALARKVNRTVDPFADDGMLVMESPAPPSIVPQEESLPAPEYVPAETQAPPESGDVGIIAFEPQTVRTPAGAPALAGDLLEELHGEPVVVGPTPAPDPAKADRPVHVVRAGENLTMIARRYYGTEGERLWQRIWKANKDTVSDPNRLATGQKLLIPGLPAETPARSADTVLAEAAAPVSGATIDRDSVPVVNAQELARMVGNQSDLLEQPSKAPATYRVRKGDTFYHIATNLYGDGRLARLLILRNKHLVPDETKLKVGQRIVLLDGVAVTGTTDLAMAHR